MRVDYKGARDAIENVIIECGGHMVFRDGHNYVRPMNNLRPFTDATRQSLIDRLNGMPYGLLTVRGRVVHGNLRLLTDGNGYRLWTESPSTEESNTNED